MSDFLGRPAKRYRRSDTIEESDLPESTATNPFDGTFQATDVEIAYDTVPIQLSSYLDNNTQDQP